MCQISTPEEFFKIVNANWLKDKVAIARNYLKNGDKLMYKNVKEKLPSFMFQAQAFKETRKGKNGNGLLGHWRTQESAILSGLVVLDIDHVDVKELLQKWADTKILIELGDTIGLIYITPSGEGLKVVFKANPQWGNLIDNQYEMAKLLQTEFDISCKDSSRSSFAVSKDDIILYNKEILFNDYGTNYDEQYGEAYRKGDSRPVNHIELNHMFCAPSTANKSRNRKVSVHTASTSMPDEHADVSADAVDTDIEGLSYGNIPLAQIAELYAKTFGEPVEGDRHRYLLEVAGHFRYLCDNNAGKLKAAVRALPWVNKWESQEHNASEINNICDSVCSHELTRFQPKAVKRVLAAAGVCSSTTGIEASTGADISGAGDSTFWDRLEPLLVDDPTYSECTELVRPENKLPAIFAAGAMLSTLMSRCSYQHYDGEMHRLNPMVFIIGKPASNKSIMQKMDNNIMAVMRAADAPGRKAEADYKAEQRKRKSSNKAASGEKQIAAPEVCIRYIPSRTSNAVFYRRCQNAKEIVDGELLPLHLYTFDSELDSQVTAQSGGSWIGKHDIELKAFHNELSGVDYANGDSVNDLIPIYWNQVVTGTDVSLTKKINMRNINDGLCSRIAIIRMYNESYQMMKRGIAAATLHAKEMQEKWGYLFDKLKGEIFCDKLIDHCYKLCEKAARVAELNNDDVLDFFRKRAIFYAEWFTIVRVVGRTLREAEEGNENADYHTPVIKDSDLQFAELIFDAVIYWQDKFFGKMLEEVWQNAANENKERPLLRTSRNEQLFETLKKEFNVDDVANLLGLKKGAARAQIMRWKERGIVKNLKRGNYGKV